MSRPHSLRLIHSLDEIRKELTDTVSPISNEELGWAPREGMKSYRALLQEIGTMEKLCIHWLRTGDMLEWNMPACVPAETTQAALSQIESIRAESKAWLESATEEQLEDLVEVPGPWKQYWGEKIEPEEGFRWIVMHEYYHLGQIISYRWIQGHDPYKPSA